jgi:nucleoside-diphosphate-sugar epimerase
MATEPGFTVIGGRGFIGGRLVGWLRQRGIQCQAPDRSDAPRDPLGHVVYAAGLTGDFRRRPFDTVTAHVSDLVPLLAERQFSSLLYLSSTRVYRGARSGREEESLKVRPGDPEDHYALSKLLGESLCLNCGRERVRIARLSNVYGPGPDLPEFLRTAIAGALSGQLVLRNPPASSRDYVNIDDVVPALVDIARGGARRLYNVASGKLTTHAQLTAELRRLTGCDVEFEPGEPVIRFPPVAIDRMREEFGYRPAHLPSVLPELIEGQAVTPTGLDYPSRA